MPLVKIQTNVNVSSEKKPDLLKQMSEIIADTLSKPESYCMAIIEQADMILGGESGPAAFIEVKSIGAINSNSTSGLADKLCSLLEKELQIKPQRVYINFSDIPGKLWGWNKSTFG